MVYGNNLSKSGTDLNIYRVFLKNSRSFAETENFNCDRYNIRIENFILRRMSVDSSPPPL